MVRLGVDVGDTNTDAALVDGDRVVATAKTPTTADVTGGIRDAMARLGTDAGVEPGPVTAVMIGTTHFVDALLAADRLAPTAVIRFGLPATRALPPLVDWPDRLHAAIGGHAHLCHGGHEYDGTRYEDFDETEFRDALGRTLDAGARSFAISSVFSPVDAEFELRAAEIIAEQVPNLPVSLSHEIGRMGLLGRENATVVNAALRGLAEQVTAGLATAVAEAGMTAPVFLSQNDGTLMDVDHARRYPVATFASGPTNSMRGAAFLAGHLDCAVIDVGGTSTDVGVLQQGFPREAPTDVSVAGIATNFRMPDILSIDIGGADAGRTGTALARTAERMAAAVERMRVSADPLPVVAVGGAGVLVPDGLAGASTVIRPEHHQVANAVGAAVAQVGGEVDRVFSAPSGRRGSVLDRARQEAVDRTVAAGARPGSVRIVKIEEVPLAYLPGNATRVRVKAIGDLALGPS